MGGVLDSPMRFAHLLFGAIVGAVALAGPSFAADDNSGEPAKKPIVKPLDLQDGYKLELNTDSHGPASDEFTPKLPQTRDEDGVRPFLGLKLKKSFETK